MRSRQAFMFGLLIGAAMVALGRYIMVVVDAPFPCDHTTIKQFPSPDGHRIAVLAVTNCGATTPYISEVQVKKLDGQPEDIDSYFAVRGKVDMSVLWEDNNSFSVEYDHPQKILRQVLIWNGAHIRYRERP